MKLSFYIAKRLVSQNGQAFSQLVSRMAIMAIALSLSVMIVASAMVSGFQNKISDKLFGVWGHIEVAAYQTNNSFENIPVHFDQSLIQRIVRIPGVRNINAFATKPGIIKTKESIEGIVLKGVDKNYDFKFIKQQLISRLSNTPLINYGDSSATSYIVISQRVAKRCNVKCGDKLILYFMDRSPLVRPFVVSGIFNTGLEEFDKIYAFVDLKQIQKVNNWKKNEIGGYEVSTANTSEINIVNEAIGNQLNPTDDLYNTTIQQKFPQLFDWLGLQSLNEKVILVLMCMVAIINIVSTLIILILERTQMVGVLKALGMRNGQLRWLFLWNASYIALIGMLWGNIIGIGICLLQYYSNLIKLPEETYYLSSVPIDLSFTTILLLNVGLLVVNLLSLWIPTILVNKISIIKAIRYE